MTTTENSPCSGKMPSLDNPAVKLATEIAVNNIYSLKMNDSNGNQTKAHFGRDDFSSSPFVYGQNRNLVSCEEVAIQTEADQFGLCERGAHLLFEGVVWHETQDGVLVVNITWRGKSYVGTLLDHSKYDWHPGANSTPMTTTENSPCSGKMPSLDNPAVKLATEIAVNNIYSLKMNDSNGNQTKAHFGRDDFSSSPFVYGQNRNLVSCEEVAIQTEADQFGLCERGAHLLFEGVVWHETQDGVLVVNITWRGKSYVGTLLDHSKYDWHPGANSYSEPEEKRATKGRNTNNSNSASMSSFPTSKRNSNAGLGNLSCPPVTSSTSSSTGGRTTNNSIAAEYDATNSKLRVHAVSPLVSNAPQSTVKTESTAATTVVPPQQQTPTGPKSRRGTQQQNSASKSPPPLTIVEDQQHPISQNEVQLTTQGANFSSAPGNATALPATGMKRKSEKNSGTEGTTPCENKTGKKPRVTITNYGANNETTLTTIIAAPLANGPPADVYWKCSEESCSKKYKHKNGLRYHITHAHGKSEAEADLIIEQEMSAHIAAMGATVTTEMVQNSNTDEELSECVPGSANGKVVSPTGKGGKKGGGSRKNSSAKEKKKPRRESEESPPGSEQGSNNASEADINSSLSNVVNNTKLSAVPENSSVTLSIGNPKVSLPEQKISPVMASNSSPSSGSKSKLQRMANLPLQGNDPANQPERKVAKVAPTTFSGSDALKQKHHSQDGESGLKLEPIIGSGGNANSNSINRSSHQQTSQNFPIQTPMYPFGAVDPKLYTNFVGQQPFTGGQEASNIVGTSHDINVNPNSPKPEGTAARIVHPNQQQQRMSGQTPSGHGGMQQNSQQWSTHPNSGFMPMQHRGGISTSSNNVVNWHTSESAGSMGVDSNMAKYMEVNAQHIAESAADSLMTPSVPTSNNSSSQIQMQPPVSQQQTSQQQMQQTSHVPTPSVPTTPIASHHVHNHIHNYVGFPPPQMMQHQQQTQMVNNPGQNPNQGAVAQNGNQGSSQKLPLKQSMPNSNTSMSQHPPHLHAQSSSINSMPPIGGQQTSVAGINPAIHNHSVVGTNSASTILPGQPGPSQPSPSQNQFASLMQGRPLAPISPYNPRGNSQ